MIVSGIVTGLTALCITGAVSPSNVESASLWCQQQQQQYFPDYSYATLDKAIARSHQESAVKVAASTDRWYGSWNSAWKIAKEQGRPLVCVFVHQGCPECERLNATLAKPAAAKSLKSAVKVKLEFTKNPKLVQSWGIKYTPTFLVFSPAHNGEVYREVGALSLDRLRTLQPSIEGLVTGPAKKGESTRESSSCLDKFRSASNT